MEISPPTSHLLCISLCHSGSSSSLYWYAFSIQFLSDQSDKAFTFSFGKILFIFS